MRDERELHDRDRADDPGERDPGPPQRTRRTIGSQCDHLMDETAQRREEGDVERRAPEPRQGHRTLPLGAFTRFGCSAMYVAVCFTRICVPSNVVE